MSPPPPRAFRVRDVITLSLVVGAVVFALSRPDTPRRARVERPDTPTARTDAPPTLSPRESPAAEEEPPAPAAEPTSGYCDGPERAPGYTPPDAWRAVEHHLQAATRGPLPGRARDAVDRAARASRERVRTEDMFNTLASAVDEAPEVPALRAWLALVSLALGRPYAGALAMDAAARAHPGEHAWWKPHAELLALTGQSRRAADLMERYAAREPGDWVAVRRARLMGVQADVEADFLVVADARFPLRHSPLVPAERARAVLQALRVAEPRCAAVLGPLPDAVSVAVYAERADLLACTCAQGWSTAVFDGRMRFQDEPGGPLRHPDALGRVAAHELMHAFQRRHGMRRDGWLVEGMARWAAGEEDARYARRRQQLAESGAYVPLSSMMGTLQEFADAEDSGLAYDQALMMVHWVVDTTGREGLQRLARTDPRVDGVEALSTVTGLGPNELGPAFMRWVRR